MQDSTEQDDKPRTPEEDELPQKETKANNKYAPKPPSIDPATLFLNRAADAGLEAANNILAYEQAVVEMSSLDTTYVGLMGIPYIVVQNAIPTLFSFVSLKSPDGSKYDVRSTTYHDNLKTLLTNEQIKESIELLSGPAAALMYQFQPRGVPKELTDFMPTANLFGSSIVLGQVADAAQYKLQVAIETAVRMSAYMMRILVEQPPKESLQGVISTTDPVVGATDLFKGDNPHPYLYGIKPDKNWLHEQILAIAAQAPLEIGEINATSVYNVKVATEIKVVTDQFTAAAINNTHRERMESNIMTTQQHQLMLQAHDFRGGSVKPTAMDTNTLYLRKPTDIERDMLCTLMLVDTSSIVQCIQKLEEQLTSTKMLQMEPISSMLKYLADATIDNNTFKNFADSIPNIGSKEFQQFVVRENYADKFDVEFTPSGNNQDVLGALFQLRNVLLDRLTFPKLVINGIASHGYTLMMALKRLYPVQYAAMITQGFTRLGAVASAAEEPMTTEQARMGYVYSIFDPAVAVSARFQQIRQIFAEPLRRVILDRKQAADLPYSSADFATSTSLNIDIDNDNERSSNAYSIAVRDLLTLLHLIWTEVNTALPVTAKTAQANLASIEMYFGKKATTVAPTAFTIAKEHEYIQTNTGYVKDCINTNSIHNPANTIMLATSMVPQFQPNSGDLIRPIGKLAVPIGIGTAFLLLCSSTVDRASMNLDTGKPSVRRQVLLPHPVPMLKFTKMLYDKAACFGLAFQTYREVLQIVSQQNVNDPFLAASLALFKNYSSVNLIKMIGEVYKVDLLTLVRVGETPVVDVRATHFALRMLQRNRTTFVNLPNTIFANADIVCCTPESRNIITMFLGICIDQGSYFRPSGEGLVLFREQVDYGMHPGQPLPVAAHRVAYTNDSFIFIQTNWMRAKALRFIDADGAQQDVWKKNDPRLAGVRLHVGASHMILPDDRMWIEEALACGLLSLELTNQMFEYTYLNITEPEDYPDSADLEAMKLVLATQRGGVPRIMAVDNRQNLWKNNRGSYPHITVSVHNLNPLTEPLVMSGMFFASERPQTFVCDNATVGATCGFGRIVGGINETPIIGGNKLDSWPNANNSLKCITSNAVLEADDDVSWNPTYII